MYPVANSTTSVEPTTPPSPFDNSDAPVAHYPSAVLLVARDQSLDTMCRRALSDAGIQCVVSTSSSQRAFELLGRNRLFDAVVIGVGAGDVKAAKLAQYMCLHRKDTPTIVMSPIGNLRVAGIVNQNNVNTRSQRFYVP